MYKKHTIYTFQNEKRCPHCESTKSTSFEVEENTKIIHVFRCEDCGIEAFDVYNLNDENTDNAHRYTRAKKIKRPREFKSVRKSED
jgi:transcription elongation factor Elf1